VNSVVRFGTAATTAALTLLGGGAPVVAAQQAVLRGAEASPIMSTLAAALERDEAAIAAFWRDIERRGTPLIEPDTSHPGHSLVTFLHRASSSDVEVELASNIVALDANAMALSGPRLPLERLGGSEVRFLTLRLRNDVRAPYRFRITRPGVESEQLIDPLNPAIWEAEQPALRASIVELPGAPDQPWRGAGAERGDWDELSLPDAAGVERTVYVYKPPGWRAGPDQRYRALVGLGAFGTGIGMRVDWMADHLVSEGAIPPMVFLLVDLDAASEASRYASTDSFVVDVVLPHARAHYGVSARAEDIAISGTSRRGMVAALVALRRPGAVGNVISLSGSYYWKPADEPAWVWVPAQFARAVRRPVRFYLAAGELETFVSPGNRGHHLVGTNRHFRDVLRARGYDLHYVEFNGVHSELNWQDWLADGLVHVFGRRTR